MKSKILALSILLAGSANAATVQEFVDIDGLEWGKTTPCYDPEAKEKEATHMCFVFKVNSSIGILASLEDGNVDRAFVVIEDNHDEIDPDELLEIVKKMAKVKPQIRRIKPEDMPHNKKSI